MFENVERRSCRVPRTVVVVVVVGRFHHLLGRRWRMLLPRTWIVGPPWSLAEECSARRRSIALVDWSRNEGGAPLMLLLLHPLLLRRHRLPPPRPSALDGEVKRARPPAVCAV